jgi:cytochrome c
VFGPSLHGVGGRKAGSLPSYDYSPALKKAKITWNAQTLDRWLASPQKTVPGTKMPLGGVQDPETRRALISYLLALK